MFGDDFYPTPPGLIDRMLEAVDWDKVKSILEPSAGRGDLIERIIEKQRYGRTITFDAIEIDPELSQVLDSKGHRPVASDFLQFKSFKQYDLVIMNPPFSNGDKHLRHALDLLSDGGQVVCLLNAETIRNPNTRSRKELIERLESVGASIEYIEGAFKDAVRSTDVEIALVSATIEKKLVSSIVENLMEAERLHTDETERTTSDIVDGDYTIGAVRRFNVEVKAGLKLIDEYLALKPILTRSFNKDFPGEILELTVNGNKYDNLKNSLVESMRMKYWQELFQSREFSRMFTSSTRDKFDKQVGDLARFEFNISNIKQLQIDLSRSMLSTLDDAIVDLFSRFTNQYYDEMSNNVHYYNGWKTNEAYIVNKRVIDRSWSAFTHYSWTANTFDPSGAHSSIVTDIVKVFSYLDGQIYDDKAVLEVLAEAKATDNTRNLDFAYCTATFYKKGTVHITFKNERLLKKFNLIGSQRKGWLPPNYGKTAYADMTPEGRNVVDEIEGQESYADTVADYGYYLEPRTSLPTMIADVKAA